MFTNNSETWRQNIESIQLMPFWRYKIARSLFSWLSMIKSESTSFLLPSTPATLCFNKEHFTRDVFDVDEFVVECRKHASLDILRTDLHVYLKILQNAMIELINKDYADFLNLSTNLVGMDKSINHLILPLNHIKKDVSELKDSAEKKLKSIEDKMKAKKSLEKKKECLMAMSEMIISLEHIERLQKLPLTEDGLSRSQLIERLANQFSHLQVLLNNNKNTKLASQLSPKVEEMMTDLRGNMDVSLKQAFLSNNKEDILMYLRAYSTINKVSEAENIFRQHIVKDYMQEAINQAELKEKGLQGMYERVLLFVSLRCGLVKNVTSGGEDSVSGYDMLVNAVWPEIASCIELNVPSIFAPGNPDVFHERYKISMSFLDFFERTFTSLASVKRLRCHPSYTAFKNKWGLSIYFQIRFQEIAGLLETSLLTPFELVDVQEECYEKLKLKTSTTLCRCLSTCWSANVFLDALLHRFWKLSLQLCARYTTWLQDLSLDLQSSSLEQQTSAKCSNCLLVLCDIRNLNLCLQEIFDKEIGVVVGKRKGLDKQAIESCKEAWKDCQRGIEKHIPNIVTFLATNLTTKCLSHLKAVNNIPRLYKRTNREAPTKASPYLASLIEPITFFKQQHSSSMHPPDFHAIMVHVVCSLSLQYQNTILEVLTSLRRMEESLKRLKAARQATSGGNAGTSSGQSDDEKIKMQLSIDVDVFFEEVTSLNLQDCKVKDALLKLKEAVNTQPLSN